MRSAALAPCPRVELYDVAYGVYSKWLPGTKCASVLFQPPPSSCLMAVFRPMCFRSMCGVCCVCIRNNGLDEHGRNVLARHIHTHTQIHALQDQRADIHPHTREPSRAENLTDETYFMCRPLPANNPSKQAVCVCACLYAVIYYADL